MIGRTVEVGSNASRVLLVTDLNSQIPVLTEKTGHRAILSGDNSALLYLKFLNTHSKVVKDERIITSGDGGLIPAGLVVGKVDQIGKQRVKVKPVEGWDDLGYVRIINYDSDTLF